MSATFPSYEDARVYATPGANTALVSARIAAIDLLRGAVIVLMALDHVRDYFSDYRGDTLDLAHTTPLMFFTRWITHFCAPTFIFLAGISAFLQRERLSPAALSRFLAVRGLWLVVLEVTVVHFGWFFDFSYQFGIGLQVIWAIGVSMLVLAALVRLPLLAIAVFGAALVFGHNLFDGIAAKDFGAWAPLWLLLHEQGFAPFGIVAYPLVPWIGVMALGYVAGALYRLTPERRARMMTTLGFAALSLFLVLRLANAYGEPRPWEPQGDTLLTVLAFLKVSKYPPSLHYLLLTLGTVLLLLPRLERARGWFADVLLAFGRVPLFAYVVHIYLTHAFAGLLGLAMGFGLSVFAAFFMMLPEGWGVPLPGVYLAWLAVLAALYPLCRWFAALKRRRRDWWLRYL